MAVIKPGAVIAKASAVAVLPTTASIAANPALLAPAFCRVENRLPAAGTGSSDSHLAAKDPVIMFSFSYVSNFLVYPPAAISVVNPAAAKALDKIATASGAATMIMMMLTVSCG
jgi:hypothetical protein